MIQKSRMRTCHGPTQRTTSAMAVLVILSLCAAGVLSGCDRSGRGPATDPTAKSADSSEEGAGQELRSAAEDSLAPRSARPNAQDDLPGDGEGRPRKALDEAFKGTDSGGETPTSAADSTTRAAEISSQAADPPPSSVPSTPDSPNNEEGNFRVELPDEERTALLEQTSQDLQTAREVVVAWKGHADLSEEMLERLHTIDEFVQEARAALAADDVRGAANLALKARLLAVEIGKP